MTTRDRSEVREQLQVAQAALEDSLGMVPPGESHDSASVRSAVNRALFWLTAALHRLEDAA